MTDLNPEQATKRARWSAVGSLLLLGDSTSWTTSDPTDTYGGPLALLLILSNATAPDALPSLALLNHVLRQVPLQASSLVDPPDCDVVIVDARQDLVGARSLCQLMSSTGAAPGPVLLVVREGGLAVVTPEWGIDDVVLDTAGPVEVEARLRLAARRGIADADAAHAREIAVGQLLIDESSYTVRVHGRPLDLTYKEFELLKFLSQHPGRVFSRAQLLQEVWGYDYFGGARTVDVHVRRVRAKLGIENEHLIGTVRNVGYRLVVHDESTPDSA